MVKNIKPEFISKIIQEVEKNPVLYDPSNENYYNESFKNRIWREIAGTGVEGERMKKTWKYLYILYRNYKRWENDENIKYLKKWVWRQPLSFLDPFLKINTSKHLMNASEKIDEEPLKNDRQDCNVKPHCHVNQVLDQVLPMRASKRLRDKNYKIYSKKKPLEIVHQGNNLKLRNPVEQVLDPALYIKKCKRLRNTNKKIDCTAKKEPLESDCQGCNVQPHCPKDQVLHPSLELEACKHSQNTNDKINCTVEKESLENEYQSCNVQSHSPAEQVIKVDNLLYDNFQDIISGYEKQKEDVYVPDDGILHVNSLIETKQFEWFANKNLDQIDDMFLCYADNFKSFMPKRQIHVKLQLAKAFNEAELKNLEDHL